jgi:hypothetical protein
MDSAKRSPQVHKSDGEDLSILLYRSGRSLKNLSLSVGRGVSRFGHAILISILFLMRNFIWVILATAIGLGYGIYLLNKSGTSYVAEMTVKTNFNSSRSLYNSVDYLNSLVNGGNTEQVSSIFGISPEDAKKLSFFSVQPVNSEVIISEMYKDQYLKVNRSGKVRLDTFWVRTMNYDDFKEGLTKYDYPLHTIKASSTNPAIFGKLQQGMVELLSKNSLLQEIKSKQALSNSQEEELLVSAIKKLDTLRDAYNQRLIRGQSGTSPSGNQLTFMEAVPDLKAPELEVYDKMLELIEELKRSRTRSVTEQEIIEVYSPFNPVGQKVSFLQQSVGRYTLMGLIAGLVIVLLMGLYRFLVKYERNHVAKTAARRPSTVLNQSS